MSYYGSDYDDAAVDFNDAYENFQVNACKKEEAPLDSIHASRAAQYFSLFQQCHFTFHLQKIRYEI